MRQHMKSTNGNLEQEQKYGMRLLTIYFCLPLKGCLIKVLIVVSRSLTQLFDSLMYSTFSVTSVTFVLNTSG